MNFENQLRSAIHEATDRETSDLNLADVIRAGRLRNRRRSLAGTSAGVLGLAVATTGITGVMGAVSGGSAWALATTPAGVNDRIDQLVVDRLPAGTEITNLRKTAYGEHLGNDGLPERLPRSEWDQAVSWRVEMEVGAGHQITVLLSHAQSEVEGDSAELCADTPGYGTCEVEDVDAQGDEVRTVFEAVGLHRDTAAIPGTSAGSGAWMTTTHPDLVPPQARWFEHGIEAQPGGDFLVQVSERIHTPSMAGLQERALLDREDLAGIGLDSELLNAG